jgi:hypothetical protein
MVALIFSATLFSCTKDTTLQKVAGTEITERPTQEVENLTMRYTADGKLRNILTTKLAWIYVNGDTTTYICPKGLYIRSFSDTVLVSDLRADSAVLKANPYNYFTAWGNVVSRNYLTNKRMITDGPMFWDEKAHTIETKVFSTIYNDLDTIYARYGIFSDDQFLNLQLHGQSGVVFKNLSPESGNSNDTANVNTETGRTPTLQDTVPAPQVKPANVNTETGRTPTLQDAVPAPQVKPADEIKVADSVITRK